MCGCCCEGKVRDHDPGDQKGVLNNPVRHRGCTDIVCLVIFAIFCGGMVFVAVFSVKTGDAFRLVYGTDSYGNTCDEDNSARANREVKFSGWNLKGRPFVFFMDVGDPDRSLTLCVNKCPEEQLDNIESVIRFSESMGSPLCRYDLDTYVYSAQNNSIFGPCPKLPVYKSTPVLNRCIPANMRSLDKWVANNIIAFLNKADIFQKILGDVYASWQEMISLCFVAVGFSVWMVLLIRFLASVIVWIIVAAVMVASVVGTSFLWWTYVGFKKTLDKQEQVDQPLLEVDINSEQAFLSFAVIASALTLILLAVLIVMWKRLSLVVALFHEAGSCVASMPMLMVQPIWTFLLLILFFVYWVIILAFLSTAEKPTVDRNGFVKYTEHEFVSYFWWYHIVGLFWISEYIIACQQFVISGAVARWYFTRNKKKVGFPILSSICRLIICHHGSVAMGAFLITLFKLPRMFLMWLNKKLKKSEKSCWCLEKCLKYLNANAYAVIAVSGRNFCSSSKKAFGIMASNALRVAALNSISDFLVFMAKLAIMAGTGAVSIIWLKPVVVQSRSDLHFYAIPVLLVCVFAYLVAHCFLSVYEMVMDTLLLCFCEDCDMNDGSAERPYFCSKRLMAFVNDSSQALNMLRQRFPRQRETTAESEPAQV